MAPINHLTGFPRCAAGPYGVVSMIHYQLRCEGGHAFEGWFRSSQAFEAQSRAALVECPACGTTTVGLGLMTPAIARGAKAPARPTQEAPTEAAAPAKTADVAVAGAPGPSMPAEMRAALQRMRADVERNCDHVGPRFAEEARAIHRGESPERAIYGETTPDQAEALADEGIEVARIPWLPRADG